MGFVIASLALALVILTILTYLSEASIGFVAPLITRTSPEHPLYDSKLTNNDITRRKQWISTDREFFFTQQRLGLVPNQVAPIDNNIVMRYFIGTPPVEALAVPDTGSGLIWLQCQPCKKCYEQTKPIFDPYFSSSYQLVQCGSPTCRIDSRFTCGWERYSDCNYDIRYGDGSSSHGVIATDTFILPPTKYSRTFTRPKTLFGCGSSNEFVYSGGASGVIGLRNVSISLAHQIGVHAFSYCTTKKGGYIRFGSASRLAGLKTKLFTDQFTAYQIVMLGIEVQYGRDIEPVETDSEIFKHIDNDPNTGVLIDSGTFLTCLNPVAFEALKSKIVYFMKGKEPYETKGYHLCYNNDDYAGPLSRATMPRVHFVLDNGVVIKIPNENIWTDIDIDGNICLQILKATSQLTIIGSDQLNSFNVGYDLTGNLLWLDYQPTGCDI